MATNRIVNGSAPDLKMDAARDWVLVTKSSDEIESGPCRGLLVGTAGTANLTTIDGDDRDNVPLVKGYNMLACSKVREGGSADDIWALY